MTQTALAPAPARTAGARIPDMLLCGPVAVSEVELSQGLATLRDRVGQAETGRQLLVLARLHSHPIGLVALADDAEDPERAWPQAARDTLAGPIDRHLCTDGSATDDLDLWAGGAREPDPACLEERRRTLQSAPHVSVIVATRDRPRQLEACIEAVLSLDYPAYDVVVVDNDPTTSETAELVEALAAETPGLAYLREDRRGLAAAHNCGLAAASGTIVAFTDDDVTVDRHWLSEIAAPFVTAGAAGASGLILPAELATPAQVQLEAHGRFGKGFEDRLYDLGPNRPDDLLFPFTAGRLGSGANMAFDTAWLRGIGGFDAATGVGTSARGGDDLLALFRLVMSGRTLAYRPSALVWHRHHRETPALRRQVYSYGVGLGAYLTSAAIHEPRALPAMMRRVPAGLTYLRSQGDTNRTRPDSWAPSLKRLEHRGLLYGPFAYGVSLARGRRYGRLTRRSPSTP